MSVVRVCVLRCRPFRIWRFACEMSSVIVAARMNRLKVHETALQSTTTYRNTNNEWKDCDSNWYFSLLHVCTAPSLTPATTGAGVGGVATAARLAKAGFKVTVVEKNHFSGGRCSLIHSDGYVRFPIARRTTHCPIHTRTLKHSPSRNSALIKALHCSCYPTSSKKSSMI